MAYTVTNNPWSSQYCVGIGTDTPCRDLHVVNGGGGAIRVGPYYASGGDRDYLEMIADGTFSRIITNNECMGIQNCGGPLLLQPNSGNVGIGTSSPSFTLDVSAPANNQGIRINSVQAAALYLYSTFNNAGNRNWGIYNNSNVFGDFDIRQSNAKDGDMTVGANGTSRLYIKNDGNVGIGTTSPSTILNVASSAPTIRLNPTTQNNVTTIEFGVLNAGTTAYAKIDATNTINYDSNLRFFTNGVGSLTQVERMRIDYSGNVGIGTASPTTGKLEVAGSILTSGGLVAALANSAALSFESTFSRLIAFGTDASTNGCFRLISSRSDGSNQLTWLAGNASGNVGINCLTPTYKLHVNGTFYAAGSSQDYKEGVCKYDTDSCMFMKLKPVTYQYKEEFKHLGKELKSQTQIGLIAEEVAEVAPELAILVNEAENKVVRNVDYEKLSIILLSEVQKLRKEVDDLKHKQ